MNVFMLAQGGSGASGGLAGAREGTSTGTGTGTGSGQSGLAGMLDIPSPPALPTGSAWQVYLLEQPWVLAGVLLLVGAIFVIVFARRDELRKGVARGGPLVLGAGLVVLLASVIDTPREQMRESARTLIASVARADIPTIRSNLTTDARLEYFGGIDVNAILDRVESNMLPGRPWAVTEHALEEVQMQSTGESTGIVQVKVRVIPEATNFPHRSWWKLQMHKGEDGAWRTKVLTPLKIQWESGVR